jgi:hypothetical protein
MRFDFENNKPAKETLDKIKKLITYRLSVSKKEYIHVYFGKVALHFEMSYKDGYESNVRMMEFNKELNIYEIVDPNYDDRYNIVPLIVEYFPGMIGSFEANELVDFIEKTSELIVTIGKLENLNTFL